MWLLEQLARWRVILLLLVLYLGFSLFLFPFYQGQIDEIAGEPLKALDLRMQYSFEDAQTLLEKMRPEGRSIAQLISGRVDMVYPIVYGLFLLLLIMRLSAKLKFRPKAWLLLVPILAMLFDYLENIQVLRMLRQYPDISPELVAFSSLMSSLKWLFVLAAVMLVLILGCIQFILWLRHKPH